MRSILSVELHSEALFEGIVAETEVGILLGDMAPLHTAGFAILITLRNPDDTSLCLYIPQFGRKSPLQFDRIKVVFKQKLELWKPTVGGVGM